MKTKQLSGPSSLLARDRGLLASWEVLKLPILGKQIAKRSRCWDGPQVSSVELARDLTPHEAEVEFDSRVDPSAQATSQSSTMARHERLAGPSGAKG